MTQIELKDGTYRLTSTDIFNIDSQIAEMIDLEDKLLSIELLFIYVNIELGMEEKPARIKVSEIKTYYTI